MAQLRASHYLWRTGDIARDEETRAVKIVISVAALAGSLGLLLSDWAGQAFPYL
jgi:hypothetical protein